MAEWILHKPRRENRNATYKCSNCGALCSSYYNDIGNWKCCPHCMVNMNLQTNDISDCLKGVHQWVCTGISLQGNTYTCVKCNTKLLKEWE